MPIDSIRIQNYKSIRDSGTIEIRPVNVLIGPNGVGKSNFISYFKLLNQIYEQRLQKFVAENGFADKMLYFGRRTSKYIKGGIKFKDSNGRVNNRYQFQLTPNQDNGLYYEVEKEGYNIFYHGFNEKWDDKDLGLIGKKESSLKDENYTRANFLKSYFEEFRVFHFHDTSSSSPLKQTASTNDYSFLRSDGSNLASYLYKIQNTHRNHFKMIEYAIRSVAPFFDRFNLRPDEINPDRIFLNWYEKNSDEYFNAHNLSDGTLRFIALSTLLLQPDPPKTIIIDEPELGLHPSAIIKLGAMIKSASIKSQIIISTQSINLLDQFKPEDVVIVEREEDQTVFKRHTATELANWLESYSMGELWSKNVLGGTP